MTLALVRRLVEEHGGQLVARGGSTGYGSEFVVTLPLIGVVRRQALVAGEADAGRGAGLERGAATT